MTFLTGMETKMARTGLESVEEFMTFLTGMETRDMGRRGRRGRRFMTFLTGMETQHGSTGKVLPRRVYDLPNRDGNRRRFFRQEVAVARFMTFLTGMETTIRESLLGRL